LKTLKIPYFLSQMANDRTTTYCIQEEGFPKVIYVATAQQGVPDHPEYVGREYAEEGMEYCEVIVHIGASDKFMEMKPWCVTATESRLSDTYQLVARKTLKFLCQMYEWHLGPTPRKYFSPLDHTRPTWEARVCTLEGLGSKEDKPTVVAMASYLLALDNMCDQQYTQVSCMTARIEVIEGRWRKSRVGLARTKARAVNAES
jgi:hypothetical protein